ncbi:hypothetical protein LTR78_004691 [Recurvomyces mirabilis]|uniref:NAD-dependent epimerase/dehydratase domain-containing protein n=2 Tax=Recurvomyces mirabilis TaxID=574656 RepID=A0AAE1C2E8_9PEZI|nr:hypothetical protein LTR78_004691 [Recurvomyces mirabilis]
MERQTATMNTVFGGSQADPPPYPYSRTRSSTAISQGSSQSLSTGKALPTPPPTYRPLEKTRDLERFALPNGSLVLVTGANGWHGMHICDQLLQHGYRVRGTVRDERNAMSLAKYFESKYGAAQFQPAIVPDMVVQGAYSAAVQGCTGVVHSASVMTFDTDPHEVVTPSIAGALHALEAAAAEPGVRRFVYCSATAAAVMQGDGKRNEVTHESWNMAAFRTAWGTASDDEARGFAVFASKYFVDVQDSALLHVAALILPDVRGQRIFAVESPYNINSVLQLLCMIYPNRVFNGDVSDHGIDLTVFKEAPYAEGLLKRMGKEGWTDLETSLSRNCEAFLDDGDQKAAI